MKNGAKIGDDAVSGAVRNRKSNVVKYLVRIGAKITDHDAMIDYLKSVEENELIIKQLGLEKD